uniref:Fibronectin type-III domain-containing protein n=1 Tax=Ciona savignyi TaxID=51511 RepID=H2YCI7_CIOSA
EPFYKQIEHCYQGNQYTSVSNNVHGFTTYQIGLHACCSSSSTTPTNCQQISQKLSLVQTIAGAPTKPTNVLWNPGNPVYISWEAPQHLNGNLNGYYVQYGLINEDIAMEDLKTVNMQSETKIICSDANNQSIYWAKVTAYNMNPDKTMVYGNYS